ncbi:MAG: hypothetical protein ACOH16_07550 [Propionibacteriaceae bacterium]
MSAITEAFAPIIGLPSWLVRKGHGSFVTLEFGEPQIEISEPHTSRLLIDGAPPEAMQRMASVHGHWHLWIYCCRWSLALGASRLAHHESDDVKMRRALHVLNGQAISSVAVDPVDASTTFTFDLGCVLATAPETSDVYGPEPVEQWMLYQPSGEVLTVRSDGMYGLEPGTTEPDDMRWLPLPP